MRSSNLPLELVAVVSLVVDTSKRLQWQAGIVLATFEIMVFEMLDFVFLFPNGLLVYGSHLALLFVVPSLLTYLTARVSHNRDLLDEAERSIENFKSAVDNLAKANEAYLDYAYSVESSSTEQERNRISRELHDLVGYALTNVIMLANAGTILLPDNSSPLGEILQNVKEQADTALQESRQILYRLRSVKSTGTAGLNGLFQLVKAFSNSTHIHVVFNYGNVRMSYGSIIDSVIYRIVQESLTNTLKHSKAKNVTVSLWQRDRDIVVAVRDDGHGAATVVEGIGLAGMRERLSTVGGSLTVDSKEYGFGVTATIPVPGEGQGELNGSNQSDDS